MKDNANTSVNTKSKTKRGRFNIIDLLLIVLALLIIATLVYVLLPSSAIRKLTADKKTNITYTIEITGIDEKYIDKIKEGDVVIDSVSKNTLGKVVSIDNPTPYKELRYNEGDAIGVLSPVEGKYNVIVTISATAEYQQGKGYTVNGTRIAVGEKIYARFPDYTCEGYSIHVPLN